MRTHLAGMLVAGLTSALLPGAFAAEVTWKAAPPVPVPAGTTSSVLQDVTILSPTDVWAVGTTWDDGPHPLAVHWDGMGWISASLPELPESPDIYGVNAVDGVASGQVWAVGSAEVEPDTDPGNPAPGNPAARLLYLPHYDGTAWRLVPGPSMSPDSRNVLTDVDMRSVDDGWAVGQSSDDKGGRRPLILRWRSGRWTQVTAPTIEGRAGLSSVFVVSENDVWAVGTRQRADGRQASLVLHWDGDSWIQVAVPGAGGETDSDTLVSVAAVGAGEVWAVGSTCDPTGPTPCRALVLRLSDDVWRLVPADITTAVVTEVVVSSTTGVWLVGFVRHEGRLQSDHAERWDGRHFVADMTLRTLHPPVARDPAKPDSALALAAAAEDKASGALWAVGWSQAPSVAPRAIYRS